MPYLQYRSGRLNLNTHTAVMGILNITPDSFSDGGRYIEVSAAVEHARKMAEDGADIVDIGAQSTRPGHTPVSAEEEWNRLEPVLKEIKAKVNIPISIDTYYPEVAAASLDAGADIINDVSGSMENYMPAVVARFGAGLIMMHAGGGADDLGSADTASKVIAGVHHYFEQAVEAAVKAGLHREQICLDPGIGFGKDRQGDLALISRLPELMKGLPLFAVLVGASRKRVIASCCDPVPPVDERLAGTIAIHTIAQWNGAHILRVHDVKEAVQAVRVADALKSILNHG